MSRVCCAVLKTLDVMDYMYPQLKMFEMENERWREVFFQKLYE